MEGDKDIIKTVIPLYTSEFEEAMMTEGDETEEKGTGMQIKIASYSDTNMQNEQIFLGGMKEGEKEEGKGSCLLLNWKKGPQGKEMVVVFGRVRVYIYIYIYIYRSSSSCSKG